MKLKNLVQPGCGAAFSLHAALLFSLCAGATVAAQSVDRPTVSTIRFEGNTHYTASFLLRQVPQKTDEPADQFSIREGRDAVATIYREAGFGDVTVSINVDGLDQFGELVYVINEGAYVRITNIVFEGNASITDRRLKKQIETKSRFWIFRSGAFDQGRVESDVAALQKFYRDEGYLDARVGFRRELAGNGRDLTIIFTVEEKTRYTVEDIRFTGNTVFSTEELLEMIETRVGEPIERPRVNRDARAIQTRYGEIGHIHATVRPIRVFSQTPGLVRITMEIAEGQQFRVGRVIVRGNTRTRDKVIRRALNLYPPDDLFNITEARAAQRRLLDTRIFSAARVVPVGNEPGVRDVLMDVKEAEKAGDFLFGFGVTSNNGLVGFLTLDLQNFDLLDTPRSLSELIKLKSFFGGGQRMRIELQPGTSLSRFRIDFTEPYLMDKPIRFDFSVFLFGRRRDGYDENRTGLTVSLNKRFERGLWAGWSGEVAVRVEDGGIDEVDLFASKEIRKDKGSNMLASIKGTLVRDRTDSRYLPTTGDRLRLSFEQVGGDHVFGKITAGYNWYKTIQTDLLERKSVLRLRAEGGAIIGEAPVIERFYAGGTGTIRGFNFRGVGERDGLDDNNIGGDYMVLLGAEYSYPLFGDNVRGHFFLDTGTVGSGTYRASIGAGVRLTIDLIGPVPLEFNIAIPFSIGTDDEEQIFSFQIGSLF